MPPPKRRSTGATSTRNQSQSRLSFNNKSRVTKQSNTLPPSDIKNKSAKRLSDQAKEQIVEQVSHQSAAEEAPATEEIKVDIEPQPAVAAATTSPTPQRRTKRKTTNSVYDEKVKEAEKKISDSRIKAYWKAEEDSRLAPRIHQKDVHLHEKILRHFDLSSQYGPCIGIARLDRWKRASGLGLDPPIEVLAVLLKEEKKGADKGDRGRQCGRLAYIDELAGGRAVLVE